MTGFGALWIAFGLTRFDSLSLPWVLAVTVVGLALLAMAFRDQRRNETFRRLTGTPVVTSGQRKSFRNINLAQWGVIAIGVSVLLKLGRQDLITPVIAAIVGAHFFALAHLFRVRIYYLTGMGLILLGCSYPLFTHFTHPESSVAIGAGAILWATTIALLTLSRPRR
jgi:hypothetical protein